MGVWVQANQDRQLKNELDRFQSRIKLHDHPLFLWVDALHYSRMLYCQDTPHIITIDKWGLNIENRI